MEMRGGMPDSFGGCVWDTSAANDPAVSVISLSQSDFPVEIKICRGQL